MNNLIGYAFLALGIVALVMGLKQLSIYIQNPDLFPIYHYITHLPVEDRTVQLQGGSMVMPAGFLKISGMGSIIVAGFLLVSVVRLLMSTGTQLLKSDVKKLAQQLVKEIQEIKKNPME